MLGLLLILLKFLLINVIYTLSIYVLLYEIIKKSLYKIKDVELIIISLGLSPAITTIILYYLLIFFPYHSSKTYILFISFVFAIPLILLRKNLIDIKGIFGNILSYYKSYSQRSRHITTLLIFILFLWLISVSVRSVTNNDEFEYWTLGKIFQRRKIITYNIVRSDHLTNFYFTGLHGFSYPLLTTWERLFNEIFDIKQEFWARSMIGYYWLLLTSFYYYWLKKLKLKYPALGILLFAFTPGIFWMSLNSGIDSFRIFFGGLTLVFYLHMLEYEGYLYVILFGLFGGICANIHTIGTIFLITYLPLIFIFMKESIFSRIKKITLAIILFLIFGGIHYPFDVIYGTGWLFSKFSFANDGTTGKPENIKTVAERTIEIADDSISDIKYNLSKKDYTLDDKLRGIGSKYRYIIIGHLGHFFKFNTVGFINWLALIITIYSLITFRKQKRLELAFLLAYSIQLSVIIIRGYPNFRYSLTILPISSFIVFYALNKYQIIDKYKTLLKIVIIFTFFYTIYNIASIKEIKKILHLTQSKQSSVINNDVYMSNMINYTKSLNIHPDNQLLSNGLYFPYYYTDEIPITYYWAGFDLYYTEKGLKTLIGDHTYGDVTYILTEELGCQYILSAENNNSYNKDFKSFLNKHTTIKYRSGEYILYKIKEQII